MTIFNENKITIIGLGYVGLPLSIAFGKKYQTYGYDIDKERVEDLIQYVDKTNETTSDQIRGAKLLKITNNFDDCLDSNIFIVTVPTPINEINEPDLTYLKSASKLIGASLKSGDIVIYESTTFPGCTEEICVPILESESGLKFNEDFFCGYSPERINPGDKVHTLEKIIKVVSGSNDETLKLIDNLYDSIIEAGTYKAPSIKVAEAAKVIENSQRDLNIAFVNELAMIFEHLNIRTDDVLKAASTKWNFLDFTPGLVGGHCIGVDPYYLTYKSQQAGYEPKIILAGRSLNDSMGSYIANKILEEIDERKLNKSNLMVGVLGLAFKENCPDIRNSKVFDIIDELNSSGLKIKVFDDWVDKNEVSNMSKIDFASQDDLLHCDILILATPHDSILKILKTKMPEIVKSSKSRIIFDIKSKLPTKPISADHLKMYYL